MNDDSQARPAFSDFHLDDRLLAAVAELGFETATPIQEAAIPILLAGGDVIGGARTGSGKTAAFGLPMLHRLAGAERGLQALVLTPTRELCIQVADALASFAKRIPGLGVATIYGGAPYAPQIRAIRDGCQVIVGTPGRVIDHLDRGTLKLDTLKVFVLDEADQMLQMGFIEEVGKILDATPDDRQMALFSATMPSAIQRIAERHLKNPKTVRPESARESVDHVRQCYMVVPNHHKIEALRRFLRASERDATLIFARTRISCGEVADELSRRGLAVEALHGDLAQPARERVVNKLRKRQIHVVVATDVAARGLDVDHISHVINYDMPINQEVYVHRIGRTARAGREGMALSFVTPGERKKISGFARRLHADISQISVPTDADIAASERDSLVAQVIATSADDDAAVDLVAAVADLTGWSSLEIAVRAMRQLAVNARVGLQPNPSAAPPEWSMSRNRRERSDDGGPSRDNGNSAELILHIGRHQGARPGDLVASLTKNLQVNSSSIGRITITPNKSFVAMPAADVAALLAKHRNLSVRGTDVRMELAGPRRSFGDGDDRGPKRPFKGRYKTNKDGAGTRPGGKGTPPRKAGGDKPLKRKTREGAPNKAKGGGKAK